MHGWFLIFGGFPEETEMIPRLHSHEPIKIKGAFTIYLIVFIALFAMTAFIQSKANDNEETKDALEGKKKDPSHVELADV